MAASWFRNYVAGLSTRRPRFDPRSVHARIVLDRVAEVFGFLLPISLHQRSILIYM
jgi:hypothetical protein